MRLEIWNRAPSLIDLLNPKKDVIPRMVILPINKIKNNKKTQTQKIYIYKIKTKKEGDTKGRTSLVTLSNLI